MHRAPSTQRLEWRFPKVGRGQEVKELGGLDGDMEYMLQMIHYQSFLGMAFILVNGYKMKSN